MDGFTHDLTINSVESEYKTTSTQNHHVSPFRDMYYYNHFIRTGGIVRVGWFVGSWGVAS
jgi:hypothetical protein